MTNKLRSQRPPPPPTAPPRIPLEKERGAAGRVLWMVGITATLLAVASVIAVVWPSGKAVVPEVSGESAISKSANVIVRRAVSTTTSQRGQDVANVGPGEDDRDGTSEPDSAKEIQAPHDETGSPTATSSAGEYVATPLGEQPESTSKPQTDDTIASEPRQAGIADAETLNGAFEALGKMPETVEKDLPVVGGTLDDVVISEPIDLGEYDAGSLIAPSFGLAYPRDVLQGQVFRCDILPDRNGWRVGVRGQALDGTSRVELASLVPRDGHLFLELNKDKATPSLLACLRRCVLLIKAVSPATPQATAEVRRAIRLIRPSGGVLSMDVNPRVSTAEVLTFVGSVPPSLVVDGNGQTAVLPNVGCRVDGELEWAGFTPGKDGRRRRTMSFSSTPSENLTDTTTLVTLPVGSPSIVIESRLNLTEGSIATKAFLAGATPEGMTLQGMGQIASSPQDQRKGLHGKIREAFKKARKEFNDADAKSVQRGIDELEGALSMVSIDADPLVRAIRDQEASHNNRLSGLGNEAVQRLLIDWRKFLRNDITPRLEVLEEAALAGATLIGEAVAPLANPVRLRVLRVEAEAIDGNERYSVPLFVSANDDRPLPGAENATGEPGATSGLE